MTVTLRTLITIFVVGIVIAIGVASFHVRSLKERTYYSGVVVSIGDMQFLMRDVHTKDFTVLMDSESKIVAGKSTTPTTISLGDRVLVEGALRDESTIDARVIRIIRLSR